MHSSVTVIVFTMVSTKTRYQFADFFIVLLETVYTKKKTSLFFFPLYYVITISLTSMNLAILDLTHTHEHSYTHLYNFMFYL